MKIKALIIIILLVLGASEFSYASKSWEITPAQEIGVHSDQAMAIEIAKAKVRQSCRDLGGTHYYLRITNLGQGFVTTENYGGIAGCSTCWIAVAQANCGYWVYD